MSFNAISYAIRICNKPTNNKIKSRKKKGKEIFHIISVFLLVQVIFRSYTTIYTIYASVTLAVRSPLANPGDPGSYSFTIHKLRQYKAITDSQSDT